MGTHARDSVRHLLSSADLSGEEFSFLLEVAAALKAKPQRLLEGRQLALVFEKPSLRTRVSFQVGCVTSVARPSTLAPKRWGWASASP